MGSKAPAGIRVCSKCDEYELHNKGQTQCKKCYTKWYQGYKDTRKRDKHYMKKFGITLAEYNKILARQEGVCASCGTTGEEGRYKNMAVDHCHTTGKIRGILCANCNRALGLVGDTSKGVRKLLKYIEETE